jgi:hypothetical protein
LAWDAVLILITCRACCGSSRHCGGGLLLVHAMLLKHARHERLLRVAHVRVMLRIRRSTRNVTLRREYGRRLVCLHLALLCRGCDGWVSGGRVRRTAIVWREVGVRIPRVGMLLLVDVVGHGCCVRYFRSTKGVQA